MQQLIFLSGGSWIAPEEVGAVVYDEVMDRVLVYSRILPEPIPAEVREDEEPVKVARSIVHIVNAQRLGLET